MLQDAEFPLGHWALGLSLLENKQLDEAKKEIRRAIELGFQLNTENAKILKDYVGKPSFQASCVNK